jgi:hypothetical protein
VTETEWAVTSLAAFDADETRTHDLKFDGETLEAQLAAAEQWLVANAGTVPSPGGSVRLFSSWMPKAGQHAMTLPASLVRALADAQGYFWMDAYPTDYGDDDPT